MDPASHRRPCAPPMFLKIDNNSLQRMAPQGDSHA
ncbi:hypothetical protein QFZ42_000741 [Variovorax paradoxus]|jgi:hypothetical protein|nr:hypothetical protein [Variovorax paradoxus]